MKNILTAISIFSVALLLSAFTTKEVTSSGVAQSAQWNTTFHYNGEQTVSLELNKAGAAVGNGNLQWSHDGVSWKNINATTYPGSSGAVVGGTTAVLVSAEVAPGSWARYIFTETGTGTGVFSGTWLAK